MVVARACLEVHEIAAYVGGGTATNRTALDAHVDSCEGCRRSIAAAMKAARSSDHERHARTLVAGTKVGRYVIAEPIGAGGMGVVYSADDPQLARKVALKLLRDDGGGSHERLAREAKALAALQHPNVVAVYELGTYEDEIFIAMELVDGTTLRRWLADAPRSIGEIVAVVRDAGKGLVAAHAKGLVHRDIKPENILVDREGRARVTDFGLARELDVRVPDGTTDASVVTKTGALLGTVPYMAPEQLRGEHADALTDQFSFAVVLHEAIHGERPFAGRTVSEILGAFERGGAPARSTRRVPAWLRRVIDRGLMVERERRYGSLATMVDALGYDPRLRRGIVVAGVLALGAGAAAAFALRPSEQGPSCDVMPPKLATVWNDARKQAVTAAFAATNRPFAADAAAAVGKIFDDYVASWRAGAIEACQATRLQGTQSAEMLDSRMACLDERLAELDALATVFATKADGKVVETAPRAAQQLTQIAACADRAALAAQVKPPNPATAQQVAALRPKLDEVRALRAAGKLDDMVAATAPLVEQSTKIGYAPLSAEVLLLRGLSEIEQAKYDAAEATLTYVTSLAEAARADEVRAEAWTQRARAAGFAAHYAEAHKNAAYAEAVLARLGPGHEAIMARLSSYEGIAYSGEGNYEKALELQQRGLELRRRIYGGESPETATAMHSTANVLYNLGRYPEARQLFEQALAIRTRVLGPNHPDVAGTLNNLAALLTAQGKNAEALEHYLRAKDVMTKVYGAKSSKVAQVLGNLANLYRYQGKYAEAVATVTEAIEIQEAAVGKDHPLVGSLYFVLGQTHLEAGDRDAAITAHSHALDVRKLKLPPEHADVLASRLALGKLALDGGDAAGALRTFTEVLAIQAKVVTLPTGDVALTHNNLGEAYLALKQPRRALEHFQQALALDEKAVGLEHGDLVIDLAAIVECELALDDAKGALATAERLDKLIALPDVAPVMRAQAQFALARAFADTDRAKARTLAETSASALATMGKPGAPALAKVKAWLASR